MTHREFYDIVVKMRKQQRAYSRSNGNDKSALQYAKHYERIIDEEIKRVELITKEKLSPRLDIL